MAIGDDVVRLIGDVDFDPGALRAKYREERDKRVRSDGNEQYVEVRTDPMRDRSGGTASPAAPSLKPMRDRSGGTASPAAPSLNLSRYVDDPYVTPGFSRLPLTDEVDVAVIGAGFGGLLMGARLREMGVKSIRLIERGGDVGGTWYWNRYPGAMCDVESYVYLPLLEEMGYIPQQRYSMAPEIFEHSKAIARRFNLYHGACFQTSVTRLEWDEPGARWIISTDRGDRMRARIVAMANGPLSRPKLPGIPGIETFAGHTFHTSRWDYAYTGGDATGHLTRLADKRVGIIGTGATAIQCVPHLGASAQQLYVFQRTPSSVDVRNNRITDPVWAASLDPGWQKRRMENFNTLVNGGDVEEDLVGDGWTDIYRKLTGIAAKRAARTLGRALTSEERTELMELADMQKMEQVRGRVDTIVRDPDTAELLKPWFRQFCKRPCFHDEYLQTFNLPNVKLVDTAGRGVERVTAEGAIVNGMAYELDCLIFATGFEVGTTYTRRAGYDIVGRDAVTLSEKWANGLRTLHGLQTHGFPNCFFLGFTQTALTVSVPHTLDEQARHVVYILAEAHRRGADIVEATAAGEDAWVHEMHSKAHLGAKFYAECTPGYYNNEGRAGNPNGYFSAAYGGGPLRFFEILEEWRAEGRMAGVELR